MKLSYDLHVHSHLSPCADRLMTPNNIFNMAMLKKLDIGAITDHNTLIQAQLYQELAKSYDYLFIYGAEITVREGFHVLVYFETATHAFIFQSIIDTLIANYPARLQEYQVISNCLDDEVGTYPYDLHATLGISLSSLAQKVRALDGMIVISHVDRPHYGLFTHHFDIESDDFDAFELKSMANLPAVLEEYPALKNKQIMFNSDAHCLEAIHEPIQFIECEDKTFASLKKAIKTL